MNPSINSINGLRLNIEFSNRSFFKKGKIANTIMGIKFINPIIIKILFSIILSDSQRNIE